MKFRNVCAYILLPAIAAILTVYFVLNSADFEFASTDVNRGDASRRNTTLLSKDAWVEFQLPTGATSIRLLTNTAVESPTIAQPSLSNPRSGLRYAVKYQLLSQSRKVIYQSDYHFRSRTKQILDFNSQETINPLLFGKSGMLATQTRMAQFSCTRFTNGVRDEAPTIMRVKILSHDAEVREVVARVDSRCLRKDLEKPSTMRRISQRVKDRISQACVYDHALLSDLERRSLLRWQSVSAATIGKTEQRFLYFIGDEEDIEISPGIMPAGVLLLPGRIVSIPVPEQDGVLRIKCDSTNMGPGKLQPISMAMNWSGNGGASDWSDARIIDANNDSFKILTGGGLLELQSDSEVVVNAYWRKSDSETNNKVGGLGQNDESQQGEINITPAPNFQRTTLCDLRDVTYSISHLNGRPTPFRLTARVGMGDIFLTAGLKPTPNTQQQEVGEIEFDTVLDPVPVNWHYLDGQGAIVQSGQLVMEVTPSRYDMFWFSGEANMVSESQRFHFDVPSHVAQIRFEMPSDYVNPALLTAAVRPPGMPAITTVPSDYLAFEKSQSPNRKWFILLPDGHNELVQQNRSFVIRAQPRSIEADPAIAAGQFDWIKFEPKNESIARQLLVPQTDIQQARRQAYPSTYFEVDAESEFDFEPFDIQVDVPRKLIFLGQKAPGQLRLFVDDQLFLDEEVLSSRGEFDLENRSLPERGKLRIETENPTTLFIGGCRVASSHKFLKRSANRLHDGRISFEFEKQSCGDELITLLVYCENDLATNAENQCRLKVDIASAEGSENVLQTASQISAEASTTNSTWTIRNRIFELQESSQQDSFIIGTSGKLNSAYRCFLKMGSDMRPGKYVVNAELIDDDRQSYVMLYTCRPGDLPQRRIRMQQVFTDKVR